MRRVWRWGSMGLFCIALGVLSHKIEKACVGAVILVLAYIIRVVINRNYEDNGFWREVLRFDSPTYRFGRTWSTGPCRVILVDPGRKKPTAIGYLSILLSIDEKQAKHYADRPNSLLVSGISDAEARYIQAELRKAGATADIYTD